MMGKRDRMEGNKPRNLKEKEEKSGVRENDEKQEKASQKVEN